MSPRSEPRSQVGDSVRRFYDDLPFNFHGTAASSARAVKRNPVATSYPDLDALLRTGRVQSVLELGCGAGWLSNCLARHYGVQVDAVDFCSRALARATEVSRRLGVAQQTRFIQTNLFDYTRDTPYDLVVSVGVLHHTGDTPGAVRHAASLVGSGGTLYLGLYHAPARRIFLEAFWKLAREHGEEAAFEHYRSLDHARAEDETLVRSWFRDQVLHPHETQHTLRETVGWLREAGLDLESTSINRFGATDDIQALFERELEYEEVSRRAIFEERRYFPGFFTALARRTR